MRRLFILLLVALIPTSAFALVESDNGPQQVTSCWIKGAPTIARGSLVSLVTGSSVTFPGRDVTGTDTDLGITKIYGVYIGDTVTSTTAEMTNGTWINVQTHGYTPIVVLDGACTTALQCRAGNIIVPSATTYEGTLLAAINIANSTTGNVSAFAQPVAGEGSVSGFLYGI